ncbi:MAG: hypothetical protein AB7F35_10460 [Acetobacteraceae bacterium]
MATNATSVGQRAAVVTEPLADTREAFEAALSKASNDNRKATKPFVGIQRRVEKAIAFLRAERLEKAEPELRRALADLQAMEGELSPAGLRQKELVCRTLAHAKLEQLRAEEAVALYRQGEAALATLPSAERWQRLREAAAQLREYALLAGLQEAAAGAVALLEEAVGFAPEPTDAWNELGMALIELGQLRGEVHYFEKAEGLFRQALSETGDSPSRRARFEINLAVSLWRQGDFDQTQKAKLHEAVAVLKRVLADLSGPESVLDGVIASELVRAEDNLGNALLLIGQTSEAIQAYNAALARLSCLPTNRDSRSTQARLLTNLGVALTRQEDVPIEEVVRAFDQALALRQAMPRAWSATQHNAADALSNAGERLSKTQPQAAQNYLEQAVRRYEDALEIRQRAQNPSGWATTSVNLALALKSLGEIVERSASGEANQLIAMDYFLRAGRLCRDVIAGTVLPEQGATRAQSMLAGNILKYLFRNGRSTGIIHGDMPSRKEIIGRIREILTDSGLQEAEWPSLFQEAIGATEQMKTGQHDPGPMPTRQELEAGGDQAGRLYRQVRTRTPVSIIDHLKEVWMPWIEAGVLTQPDLLARDRSAYRALVAWRSKPDNDLQAVLGYDVPTKSALVDQSIAQAQAHTDSRSNLPARVDWALRSRARNRRTDIDR